MATNENVKGIQIQIGGDTTPLYNALNEASKKTKELESDLVALNKSLKTDPKNVELLQKKFDTLGGIVESCTDEVNTLRKGLSSAELKFKNGEITEEQFKEIANSTEQAEKKLKFYTDQFEAFKKKESILIETTNEMEKLAKEHEDLTIAFGEYTSELQNTDFQTQPEKWQETKQKVDETRDAIEQNNQQMDETVGKANAIKQEMEQASSGMQTFADASKEASGGMGELGSEEATFEGKLAKLKDGLSMSSVGFAAMNEAVKLVSKGIQELAKKIEDWLENLDEVDIATKQMAKDTKEWLKSLEKSTRDNKLDIAVLDARFKSIEKLNKEILEGNKLGNDTTKQRLQLKRAVEELNKATGEETLHINEQTGALVENARQFSLTREQILLQAEALYEYNKVMELVARQHEIEEQIAGRTFQNYAGGLGDLQKELDEVNKALVKHTNAYEEASTKEAKYYDEIPSKITAFDKLKEGQGKAYDKMVAKLKEYRDKNAEYYNSVYSKIKDTNKAINDISETSLQERLDILKKNGQAILNYESNLAYLRTLQMQTMNGDQKEALDEMIRLLSDGSEDSMQILNLLVADFKEKGGETAWAYIQEFTRKDIPGSIYNVGTQTIKSFAQGMRDTQSSLMRVAYEIAAKLRQKFQKKFTIKEIHGGAGMYVTDMAQGGIVTSPTYIRAGELGAEAILPLDKLAGIITQTMNRGNGVTGGTAIMNVYPQSMSASQQEMLFKKFDRMMGQSTSTQEVG